MFGKTLQARLLTPVSAFVLIMVVGGSLLFSRAESSRIRAEVAATAGAQIEGVEKILGVTDALVMQQVQGAMRLLIERGDKLGPPSLGVPTQVKDKTVPTLLLGSQSQANHYELVDAVTQLVGGTATLFVKSGDDFVRVSTNVKRDGERAVGTVLDPKGKAMAALQQGKAFYGLVDILGNPYLTGYEPMRNAGGELVGVWYVGYKVDMDALKAVVEKSRLLESGFVAIVDGKGKARFHPPRIPAEQAEKFASEGATGWEVSRQVFEAWGFTIVAAYPDAEVSAMTRSRTISIVLIGLIGSAVMIALIAVLLRRLVLQPLGGEPELAAEMTRRIAAGDLTTTVAVRAGDRDSLMASIHTMQSALRQMVESIQHSSTAVVSAAEVVSDMSSRISVGATEQHDATASIAATLEEVTVSISHISDNADRAREMATEAGHLSETGNRVVGIAADEMQRSAEAVNQSAIQVEHLGESSRAISAIVNVIKDIADQTNLLALNAAIEAARAGEAGRGFAVVADEVRKLAERTAQSTHEITAMIDDIQKRTGDAISGIAAGTDLVNGSVEKAGEASSGMAGIGAATVRLGEAVGSISEALKEQRVASEEIARRVDQVASVNEANSVSVRAMAEQAEALERLADELKTAVNIFRM